MIKENLIQEIKNQINQNNKPDYKYIENYIKSSFYGDRI